MLCQMKNAAQHPLPGAEPENGMHQSSTSIKNRENRISLIVTVHGRFFNSYRNFESSVKRIDSVKMRVIVQIEQIKRARNCSPGKSGKGLTGGA